MSNGVKNPYSRPIGKLSANITKCLIQYSGKFVIPLSVCTREALAVALRENYEAFNTDPMSFARRNKKSIHVSVENMFAARPSIIASMEAAVRAAKGHPVAKMGFMAKLAGYDAACLILLTSLSRDTSQWSPVYASIKVLNNQDDGLLKDWVKLTGAPLVAGDIDRRSLAFGMEE